MLQFPDMGKYFLRLDESKFSKGTMLQTWSFYRRNWGGFIPFILLLLWGVVTSISDVDSVIEFLAGRSGTGKMLKTVVTDYPLFFPLIVAVWTIGFVRWRLGKDRDKAITQFGEEWVKIKKKRQELRRMVKSAFDVWRKNNSNFSSSVELAKKVSIPADLIVLPKDLYGYAGRVKRGWYGERRELLSFSAALYPECGESSLLTQDEWQAFHDAREEVAKFWNYWGRKVFEDKVIAINDFASDMILSEVLHLTVLTYLEVAYSRRTEEWSPGKKELFKITKAFRGKSNLP